jgi:hypothetical protein
VPEFLAILEDYVASRYTATRSPVGVAEAGLPR